MKRIIQHLFWFIGLILLQVLLIDNVHVLGLFLPVIYIYAILRLPSNTSSYVVIIISFLTGMVMDIFSNTPGLHTSATTLMGALRYPVIRLFVLEEDLTSKNTGVIWMGRAVFWKYAFILVLIHHTCLFFLESLSFMNWWLLVVRIFASTALTFALIMALELLNKEDNAR
jgi:hypothetical protein